MTGRLVAVAIDCHDADVVTAFRCEALGYQALNRWNDGRGTRYLEIGADDVVLLFQGGGRAEDGEQPAPPRSAATTLNRRDVDRAHVVSPVHVSGGVHGGHEVCAVGTRAGVLLLAGRNEPRPAWMSSRPAAVGSRVAFVAEFLGRRLECTYEIRELLPGHRLVMSTAQGPFPMKRPTHGKHAAGGTKMILRNRGMPSGFSTAVAPMMARATRRANGKDLEELEAILEPGRRARCRHSCLAGPMGQVVVTAERRIERPAEEVYAAVADYEAIRPRVLTQHYRDYQVREGGRGAGTVVHWVLQPTRKRVRDCLIDVSEPEPGQLLERDRNSTMTTTWSVREAGADGSWVQVQTSWRGAGGMAGFFERTFAPGGMRRIYNEVLTNLAGALGRMP